MDLPAHGNRLRANRIEQSLPRWGRDLYGAVFDYGDHRDLIRNLLDAPAPRLLTIATTDGEILRLPWELMADERGALTRRDVTIRRQLETVKENLPYTVGTPLRVLLVVSRPDDTGFIDPRHSTRAMLAALKPLRENVTVEFCRPPTLARLEQILADSDGDYDIVHFDGHGNYDRLLGLGVLLFEKELTAGRSRVDKDPVRADRLGNLLARYNIPLVILEACRTSEVDDVAFRAVAPRLIEAGVGSVVAMSYAVHVEAAKILIERFYSELAAGRTIGAAMESGRGALIAKPDRWLKYGPGGETVQLEDWFLPQLYQRGQDMVLVESSVEGPESRGGTPEDSSALDSGPSTLDSFPRPPLYEFHGRARELQNLERAFRVDRAILLHAMGGMGKTTLAREAALWLTETGLFSAGACFLSFEQPVTAERIASVLGTYLEGAAFESLSQEEQLAHAHQLFQQNDVLMVWDNFESVLEQFGGVGVPPSGGNEDRLKPGLQQDGPSYGEERAAIINLFRDWTQDSTGCGRLLITCRPQEAGLPGVRRMELRGLARPDSLYLLAQVLRKHDLSLDDPRLDQEGLDELLDVLADHPLSVELVGPHLKKLTPDEIVADFHQLLDQFQGDAEVERNRSLLASLRFSTSRLSEPAQAAVRWLGLFQGGVFEQVLLNVSQIDPSDWDVVRGELEATALIRVETDIQIGDRPFLRFHPTLSFATRTDGILPSDQPDRASGRSSGEPWASAQRLISVPHSEETRHRFIAVYDALDTAIGKALDGTNARGGMRVLAREEANFRQAVHWAVEVGQFDVAAPMGSTFRDYLERCARLRERDRWSAWLADAAEQVDFSEAAAAAERERAWSLFTQGQAAQAVGRLEALIERLQNTTEFDPAFQLALTQQRLGRVYYAAGHAERAIPILTEAAGQWEQLVAQAVSLSADETIDALVGWTPSSVQPVATDSTDEGVHATTKGRLAACATQLGNLSATLGDLANALTAAGSLDHALETAERCVAIRTVLEHNREIATDLGRTAQILMEQGRHREADARYDQTLQAVRRVGDRDLEGSILQHQGLLARRMEQYDRAVDLYQQALKLFQEANHENGVMQTCNLLGVVERKSGRLPEARSWYERSREIARRRNDTESLGIAAQNIGIVCQQEGEAALQQGDEATARQHFERAEQSILESLQAWATTGNKPNEAASQGQLAQLYLLMGELDQAEQHAHRAREIRESLGLKEVSRNYHTLADIARARGDEAKAAEWEAKRDEARAELHRRATGGDGAAAGLPQQAVAALTQLAIACLQAGLGGTAPAAEAESALAQLESADAGPLQPVGRYLRRLAAGPPDQTLAALAAPPDDLPQPLPELFAQLLQAAQQAGQ